MELTNLSHSEAKSHYNSSLNMKKTALNRLSNGNRLNMLGVDAGALSVSMKLSSNQKVLNGKMTSIQNTLSYLNAQEGATLANTTHNDIRNTLINQINNRTASELNRGFSAVAGGSGELIISERNAGDTFSVTRSVFAGDILTKAQLVPNVSPFSIESSMNFLAEMLSQNGADQSRLKIAHDNLEEHFSMGEQAISRISDADTAKEATRLARSSLKLGLATQVMSRASRLTDLLTPLTTEHFRSEVLSASL